MKRCLDCKIDYEDSAIYCKKCGKELKDVQTLLNAKGLEKDTFCTNCGNRIGANFEFCPQCGTSVFQDLQPNVNVSENEVDSKKQSQLKSVHKHRKVFAIVGVVMVCMCIVAVGIWMHFGSGQDDIVMGEEELVPQYEMDELVYLKDDEYYIVDKDGNNVQITQNYYGNVKEATSIYYESGEWENDAEYIWWDDDGNSCTRENFTWEEFWEYERGDWKECVVTATAFDDKEMLVYGDELEGEAYCYYDSEEESYYSNYNSEGYNLYCRSLDDLSSTPTLIDTGIESHEILEGSYVSYVKYGSVDVVIYDLSSMQIVTGEVDTESMSYVENEIYLKERPSFDDEGETVEDLYIHKEDGNELFETAIIDFDNSAKDKGVYYYVNVNHEFYKYDIEDGKQLVEENVYWISEGFAEGEIYYAVADEQKATMGDFIKNDTSEPDLWLMDETFYYNTYQYYYYNGKKSVELRESLVVGDAWSREGYQYNGYFTPENVFAMKEEQAAKAKPYCVLTIKDTEELPKVLQSTLMEEAQSEWEWQQDEMANATEGFYAYEEWDGSVSKELAQEMLGHAISYKGDEVYVLALEDATLKELEGENISGIHFNEAGTDFVYMNTEDDEKKLMRGYIKGKNVKITCEDKRMEELEIAEYRKFRNQASRYYYGFIGEELWYVGCEKDGNGKSGFYVNHKQVDKGSIDGFDMSEKKYGVMYYYNKDSEKYMCYEDGKLRTIVEGVSSVSDEDNIIFYIKNDVRYWYNLDTGTEVEIGVASDLEGYYYRKNADLCYYTKRSQDNEYLYDLYVVVPDGEDILLESQIQKVLE